MQASSVPYKFTMPWAASATTGYINTIPATTSVTGNASQTLGFPPATAAPSGSGGVPPQISDFNGVLNYETLWSQWFQAGGPITYDSTFATAIGGYPKGATLQSSAGNFVWMSTADNNTTNPDGSGAANWVQPYAALAGSSSQQFNVAAATSAANAVALSQFGNSFLGNGYQALPGGGLLQWGYQSLTNSTFNFPIAFPNACLAFFASNSNSQGTGNDNAYGYSVSKTQFFIATKGSGGNVSSFPCYWLAIGY